MAQEEIINIAALVRKNFDSLPSSTSKPCIYRIPPELLELNEKAYLPKVVSIGPIHCNKPYLEATQKLKSQHLQCFLQQTSVHCSLEGYLLSLKDKEEEARSYYEDEETVSLSSHDFIQILLTDAVFIINYLIDSSPEVRTRSPGLNLIMRRYRIRSSVVQDIFLEENQIPFFILQMIYDMSFGKIITSVTLIDLICTFPYQIDIAVEKVKEEASNIVHLLDFMRICMKPSTDKNSSEYTPLRSSATHLKAVGVKFQASESKILSDITFDGRVLRIPRFKVHDATESLYRNILAFEKCDIYSDFSGYMSFLDELINTPKDVHILVESGIIENWLGSEDAVAHLFNNITIGIDLNRRKYYYSDIVKSLNEHASVKFNRWKAILKQNYFSHPWTIISLIYALILFILTLLQTIGTFTQ